MGVIAAANLRVLEEMRRQVAEAIATLDDAQINREVSGLRNTVGIVVRHLAGSERYWIGEVVGGRPAHRNRDAEFGHDPLRKSQLLAELDSVGALTADVLGRISDDEMRSEVELRRRQETYRETKAWAIAHAIEHTGYHLGQLRYLVKFLQNP